jgi:hypothetical protein
MVPSPKKQEGIFKNISGDYLQYKKSQATKNSQGTRVSVCFHTQIFKSQWRIKHHESSFI